MLSLGEGGELSRVQPSGSERSNTMAAAGAAAAQLASESQNLVTWQRAHSYNAGQV